MDTAVLTTRPHVYIINKTPVIYLFQEYMVVSIGICLSTFDTESMTCCRNVPRDWDNH